MRFYQATTFLFPRRYEWRILFVCFAAVLLPPLACAAYQAATGQWQPEILLVLLGAALLSAALGLVAIRALLRPIETATQLLRAAQAGERVGPVPVGQADLVGRWGGEEFAILFPDTLLEEARMVMERLRASIALDPSLQGDEWPVTFSCGLAPVRSYAHLDRATRNADGALYAARNGGRNRVQISRDD